MNQFVYLALRLKRYGALPSGSGAALKNRGSSVHNPACFAIVATIPPATKQPVRVPGYSVVK